MCLGREGCVCVGRKGRKVGGRGGGAMCISLPAGILFKTAAISRDGCTSLGVHFTNSESVFKT